MMKDGLYTIHLSRYSIDLDYHELIEVISNRATVIACSAETVYGTCSYPFYPLLSHRFDTVDVKDLPLYIGWPFKLKRFEELLKGE
jgi:hypothetical protein